jgi:hypothetical protein
MSTEMELAVADPVRRPGVVVTPEDVMPLLDLATAVRRHNFMVDVTRNLMIPDVDYGTIPGASKPTLLKPGAERLCTLFGLSPELHEVEAVEDWTGENHAGEPFFYYRYKVRLMKNGLLLGEGIGSANSWESKYRYRAAERKCPKCGAAAIIRGREEYGGGWLCFAKKGGCGAKFKAGDQQIEKQETGRVLNPDVADVVNTLQKMAHKRALISAVLVATNASEFYSQDAEDLRMIDIPARPPEQTKPSEDVPAELAAILAGMRAESRESIGQALHGLAKDLAGRIGEQAAAAEFARLLKQYGVDKWETLGSLKRAKQFASDLYAVKQQVPASFDREPELFEDEPLETAHAE